MLNTPVEQLEQFRTSVLRHIREQLPSEEWAQLRGYAAGQACGLMPPEPLDAKATPEQLVAEHTHEDSLGVVDILRVFSGVPIDEIGGQPVYYCPGKGVYVWSKSPDDRFSLSFWVTHPAYPPGW